MTKIDTIDEDISGDLIPVNEEDYEIIETDEAATSLLERIAARVHKISKLQELYMARIQPLKDKIDMASIWLDGEKVKLDREIGYLKGPLEEFMRAINASNPKIKSLNLPTGTLKLRKSPDKVIIAEGFKATADDFGKPGIMEKLTYEVSKDAIKDHIKKTGEELDYAHIEIGETKFDYEVF